MTLALHPQLRYVWRKPGRPKSYASVGMSGPKSRFSEEDFEEWCRLFVVEGLQFTEIGERYGVSREYPRLIVSERLGGTDQVKAIRARHQRQRESDRLAATLIERMQTAKPCRVCGAWVLRSPGLMTCSRECARAWAGGAWMEDPVRRENHRKMCARSILRRPELYKSSQVKWAEKMLSESPPPRNRRFLVKGSRMAEARRIKRENAA